VTIEHNLVDEYVINNYYLVKKRNKLLKLPQLE